MTTSTLLSPAALRRVLFNAAATVLLSMPAAAATFTWGTVANISGVNDVSTTGTLISAYNIGGANVTVNGVTFTGIGSSTQTTGLTSASAAGISSIGFAGSSFFTSNAPTNSPYALLPTAYKDLLKSGGYVGFNNSTNNGTFTLSGLTIGKTYSLQLWANDSRGTTSTYGSQTGINTRTSVYTSGIGATLFQNVGGTGSVNFGGGLGQTVSGTFVADATIQAITFTSNPLLNAYQLRDISPIPEPSAFAALIGVATLGFALVRRRSRTVTA